MSPCPPRWAVGRRVVRRYAAGRSVRLGAHHLIHQRGERRDARRGFDAAHQIGPVHVVSGQVRDGAATPLLELQTVPDAGSRRQRRMGTGQDLDPGFSSLLITYSPSDSFASCQIR